MELVEAGKEELDNYVDLWFSLAKGMEKYSELNKIIYSNAGKVPEDGFVEQIENENYTYYLIKDNADTIGFLTTKIGKHPSRKYSQYTKIVNLFIKENHRNQGLGTETVQKVKEIARENGSDHLKVSSEWENEKARKFYKDNGFKEKQVEFAQKLE